MTDIGYDSLSREVEALQREVDDLKEAIRAIVKTNHLLVVPMYVWETVHGCVPEFEVPNEEVH